ncbi:hypothetical protein QQZ08_009107 [Neonectria magnoliae]|uniref:Major facilitator superfamily (MFS) profile domain-containing protein n=1 Tax=Neonectria magnoliae TaxID=2732573 RepID=A0ABR1HQJ1_9HYPO
MGLFNKKNKDKMDLAENTVGPELLKHLLLLNLILLVPLLSSSAVGYDGSMMNGLQALPQWRNFLNNSPAPILGAINAVYPVCKIMGLVPASWISDRWGRKMLIYLGLTALIFGPAFQAASMNFPMFIVPRGFIGFATVFPHVACPILVYELAYPTHRGKITALYNTFFYFGAIGAAWITYGTFTIQSTWAWRIPSVLQAAISFLQLLFIYWVPESPRALELEQNQESSTSWLTLVQTGPMRKRTFIAFIFVVFFFYDIAWIPLLQAYTIEIFSFLTRSRGLTTELTSSCIGLMTAQLINPVGLAAIVWKYYIVF